MKNLARKVAIVSLVAGGIISGIGLYENVKEIINDDISSKPALYEMGGLVVGLSGLKVAKHFYDKENKYNQIN